APLRLLPWPAWPLVERPPRRPQPAHGALRSPLPRRAGEAARPLAARPPGLASSATPRGLRARAGGRPGGARPLRRRALGEDRRGAWRTSQPPPSVMLLANGLGAPGPAGHRRVFQS